MKPGVYAADEKRAADDIAKRGGYEVVAYHRTDSDISALEDPRRNEKHIGYRVFVTESDESKDRKPTACHLLCQSIA